MADMVDEDDYYDCYDDDYDCRGDANDGSAEILTFSDVDPEDFDYVCLSEEGVQGILNQSIGQLCSALNLKSSAARSLLIRNRWDVQLAIRYTLAPPPEAVNSNKVHLSQRFRKVSESDPNLCSVCLTSAIALKEYTCGHSFCFGCWDIYLDNQVNEGKGSSIYCMDSNCDAEINEEFVMRYLTSPVSRKKYQRNLLRGCVESHPQLLHCPTFTCSTVFFAKQPSYKRVDCPNCHGSFCFTCGSEYHLPCDCRTVRLWWKKVFDDSDTMSYMSEFTKDCPSCASSIEKSGGCNHMVCKMCAHEFCWMCLGEWKEHGNAFYECNKFSSKKLAALADGPPAVYGAKNESTGKASAGRIALNKYLFYFQRYKNHEQSLRLEENVIKQIRDRVELKVKNREGSLIDWQFLEEAGKLLLKCRRTLQFTYAFAYYLEDGPSRMLFEHLQADLESTIENLSFSIERAETVDAASLQAQMRSAEFRRRALFRDAAGLHGAVNYDQSFKQEASPA